MASKYPFEDFLKKFQPITAGEILRDAMIKASNAGLDEFTNEGLDYYDQVEFFKYPQTVEE